MDGLRGTGWAQNTNDMKKITLSLALGWLLWSPGVAQSKVQFDTLYYDKDWKGSCKNGLQECEQALCTESGLALQHVLGLCGMAYAFL